MSENGNNRSRAVRASATVANNRNNRNSDGRQSKNSSAGQKNISGNSKGNDNDLGAKVAVVVFVIVLIVLFLCNFGIIGKVGDAVSGFLFGVFGLLAYITPICIGALYFCYKNFKHRPDAMKIIISSVCLYYLIAIICDMVSKTGVGMESYSFTALYNLGRDGRCGGGLVSGSLAFLIKSLIGTVGLVIFLILGMVICLLFITRGYLWTFVAGLFTNFVQDREVRAGYREERRNAEREKRRQEQLQSEEDYEKYLEDKNNKVDRTLEESESEKSDTDQSNYVPTAREKFRNKVASYNEKAKTDRAEKKKLNEEARENNEILKKISLPKDERPTATKYVPKEEMHEVYVDLQGDTVSAPSVIPEKNEEFDYNAPNYETSNFETSNFESSGYEVPNYEDSNRTASKNISGSGYPEGYKFAGQSVNRDGITSSVHKENFEKISIKKQSIRSEHTVSITEDYEPIDIKNDTPYNSDNDLNKFEEEQNSTDKDVYNESSVSVGAFENNDVDDTYLSADVTGGSKETVPSATVKQDIPPVADAETEVNMQEDSPADNKIAYSARKYKFPPISLLKPGKAGIKIDKNKLSDTAARLEETLRSFGVNVQVNNYVQGPTVTRFEMTLEPGTKVSKILSLADDIKLSLASADVRIEAPIPGKSAVGIEVPNDENSAVALRTLIESDNFKNSSSTLSFAVGMNIGGETVVTDIAKMPHVLIAGSTGSGKSVCINTLIMSIIYKSTPEEVQMILIDPKVVELSIYNGIPHLAIPVVNDPQKASAALDWAVKEMDRRYKLFSDLTVRDLKGYNEKIDSNPELLPKHTKLPKIIIIIDELADLMMTCGKEVEASICRLAQLARACGIHLVVATQRPSVDVITGLIKANMPSRMAFAVSSGVDSRTILDTVGAEKLLGKGDMLFYPQGKAKPERVQGAFVSDEEVADVVQFLLAQKLQNPFPDIANIDLESSGHDEDTVKIGAAAGASLGDSESKDEFYAEAGRLIINTGKASMGFLQRKFKIGFNRAARIMDSLAEDGVVGEESGTKAREILMTIEQFEAFLDDNGIK